MLDYYEVDPLPEVCQKCLETSDDNDECYNCDHALERWHLLSRNDRRDLKAEKERE